jgi:alpha-galactosidase
MAQKRKIVVIGAGSAEFGLDSLAGILRMQGLHGCELVLVDVNEEKLRIVERLASRINREWNSDMRISATADRKSALMDAGFVILSVAVDREVSWQVDHQIALKYHITHYAENGGPGGFAHATRNIHLLLPILRDIEEISPDAYVITFSNPLTRICTAIDKLTNLNNVGICHGIGAGYWLLANILHEELGISPATDPRFLWRDDRIVDFEAYQEIAKSKYSIIAAGLNHFTWILSVKDKSTGEDIYPYLKEKIRYLDKRIEPLSQRLFEIFGLIPVNGDTHVSEYLPYTSNARENTWEQFDIQLYDFAWSNKRRDSTIQLIKELGEGHGSIQDLLEIPSERAEFVIDAILNDRNSYEEAVNIPNCGAIHNLPDDAIVEVPGLINANGVSGIQVGELPEAISAICRNQISINNLNVEAIAKGGKEYIYQLFAIDPMITNLDTAMELADEYMKLYQKSFPAFS